MSSFLSMSRLRSLRQLDLSSTELPPSDYNLLIDHINKDGLRKLALLKLVNVDMSAVAAGNLVKALVKIKEVQIRGRHRLLNANVNCLTTLQCQELLDSIRTLEKKQRKLQVLDIALNTLSQVSSDSLAEAVVTLRNVDLGQTNLTGKQCQLLMETCLLYTSPSPRD